MTDSFAAVSATAADTIAVGRRNPNGPRWTVGTAQSVTDEDGDVEVLVDGPDVTSTDDESTSDDANSPIIARSVGPLVAAGQRVVVVESPDGTTWVVGSPGGLPQVLGAATVAPNTANQTVVSTSEAEVTGGRVEGCEVRWPDHVVAVTVGGHFRADGTGNLIGRVRRIDEDGTDVEVGRFLRSSSLSATQTMQAGPTVMDFDAEPGVYTYYLTVQASNTGWTVVTDLPVLTPLSVVVTDLGAQPTSTTRT